MSKIYNQISNELRTEIIEKLNDGMRWSDVAKHFDIDFAIVQSVGLSELHRVETMNNQQDGKIRHWGGMRLNDGKSSPVTTYHISELKR